MLTYMYLMMRRIWNTEDKKGASWSVPFPTNLLAFGLEMSVAAQRHLNWKTDLKHNSCVNTDHSETTGFNVKQKLLWLSFVTGCNGGEDWKSES